MAGRQKIPFFLALIALLVILAAYHVLDAGKAHRVEHVYDGDTIGLEDGTKVRLIGVDAPEVDSLLEKGALRGAEQVVPDRAHPAQGGYPVGRRSVARQIRQDARLCVC